MNKKLDFAGLRIYGLLTDLIQFKFYSYDPTTRQFYFDEMILVNTKRTSIIFDMVDGLWIPPLQSPRSDLFCSVADKIFGVILTAYMDGLRAIIKRRQDRAKRNDVRYRLSTVYRYEIADTSPVFIDEFRPWRIIRTEYPSPPEGKFLRWIDPLRLTPLIAFEPRGRREEKRWPKID